jgi:hypothetical protein
MRNIMLFQSRTLVRCLAVSALTAAVLALAIDQCDARRGGGRGGGGGFRGGGGGFGGGAHLSNGFHHRPSGGGNYHRPGAGFGGGAHVDNSPPGRPGDGRPDRPDRPDRPGGDLDRPGDGGGQDRPSGGDNNNYYVGWDNPPYGYGVATGLAIGTYVYSVAPDCVHEQYGGLTYRRCGDVWYQPQYEDVGIRYVVVRRPY